MGLERLVRNPRNVIASLLAGGAISALVAGCNAESLPGISTLAPIAQSTSVPTATVEPTEYPTSTPTEVFTPTPEATPILYENLERLCEEEGAQQFLIEKPEEIDYTALARDPATPECFGETLEEKEACLKYIFETQIVEHEGNSGKKLCKIYLDMGEEEPELDESVFLPFIISEYPPRPKITGELFFDMNGSGLRDETAFVYDNEFFDPENFEGRPELFEAVQQLGELENGQLVVMQEPTLYDGLEVCINDICNAPESDGSYSISFDELPEVGKLVIHDLHSDEPALALRYVNEFKEDVFVPSYEMNGVVVPDQHLNDTAVRKISNRLYIMVEDNKEYDFGLMQGFMTAPFLSNQMQKFDLYNHFDLDPEGLSVRNYDGYVDYEYYRDQHMGDDWSCEKGDWIVLTMPGFVYEAVERPNGNKQVSVNHMGGFMTGSAHLDSVLVTEGEAQRGRIIGTCGESGSPGYIHLHLSLWDGDRRDSEGWPAAMDPFRDLIVGEEEWIVQETTPHSHLYTFQIGGPGYWTTDLMLVPPF